MGNRTVITYFLSILGASLLFFGIASAGSFAAETFIFGKRFGDHTYAGPFNLSKQTGKEAEIKLTSDLLGMQDKIQADLLYQDALIPLPVELVQYNPAATIEQAESESENSLVASVSEDGLRTLLEQQLPMITFTNSEIAAIAAGVSEKLESGIMPQSIVLTDYLESSQPMSEVATASVAIDGLTAPMFGLLSELDGSQLEPKTQFSLLTFIDENQPGLLNEDELTILASAIYKASLQTNFWIEDRTIRRELTKGVEPGFEASINAQLGLDYRMTNPNHTSYTLHAKWEAGFLTVTIEGLPLKYQYDPYVAETNTFKPKTVVQYSEDLSRGQVRVEEPGINGFEIIVQRKLLEDGALITTEPVSEDFYPPSSRVEQLPLVEIETAPGAEAGNPSGSTTGDGASTNSGSGNAEGTEGDTTSGSDSGGTSTNKPGSSSNGTGSKPSKNPDDAVGSNNGIPSTKPEGDGHVYDKGGNLIK
ncbi:G5 domain-containing protein [Sporosarcina sp. A2]|uniref:G5 domain-containing protein n=1 Tax=Sporosarcina sp. A2 TaxID=3393449 RepID=UPI003D7AC8D0